MAEIPNDIPGNSKRSQQSPPQGDGRPPIPVFDGPSAGVKRKQSGAFWRWFKKMFLSDRKPRDILKEVVEYRIVPGIKDNFRNSAMAALDSFIYPGGSAAPVSSQNGVNYNKIYSGNTKSAPAVTTQTTDTRAEEINKGFANPCFKSRVSRILPNGEREPGAEEFLALMKSYDYPTLSVHTLYMMQKKHIDYTWDAYGWTKEEIMALGPGCIRPVSNPEWPWMIVLPEAHVIA